MAVGGSSSIGPVRAFFYPYHGLRFLLRQPRLLPYVAIPVSVNALLYSLILWFTTSRFSTWLEQLVPQGEAWYWAVLSAVAWVLFALLLILVVVYTFTVIGNLLLAPFNGFLSEKVEWIHTGHRLDEPFRLAPLLKDLGRSLRAEAGRLLLFGSGFLALLLINLLPVLGTAIYGVALPLFTFLFLGWEYLDHSMERWHLPFRDKRSLVLRNLGVLMGFGAGATLLLLIPLLNLLAIPVCVVGGTLLICDLRAADRTPPPRTLDG